MIKINCLFCKKIFFVHPYRKNIAKFCCKSCLAKSKIGKKNSSWKGGKINRKNGYVFVYYPKHPFAKDNYIMEHRLVMERYINRFLYPNEVVHHRNGIKNDNRIENLILYDNQSLHVKEHKKNGEMRGKDWNGLKMNNNIRKKMSISAKKAWEIRRVSI